jgi:hypothetical protein
VDACHPQKFLIGALILAQLVQTLEHMKAKTLAQRVGVALVAGGRQLMPTLCKTDPQGVCITFAGGLRPIAAYTRTMQELSRR